MKLRTAVAHDKPKSATASHFQQNIETADFDAPVLFAGVYEYDAIELGFEGGGRVRVYYPPEELAQKDFVQSVFYSAVSVGTHEKNTREENADPDGWIREAVFIPKMKGVFARGVIYTKKNVDYVTANEKNSKFGTSAFFRATYTPKKGTSPEGEEYDFIGSDLVCNHLAILENPRDDKNVVVITKVNRAVTAHARRIRHNYQKNPDGGIITMAEEAKPAVDKDAIRNAMEDIKNEDAEKNRVGELESQLKNANEKIAGLEKAMGELKPPAAQAANAEETEEEKKKREEGEAANAAHGMPSQEVVKTFAKHYGRDFGRVTPTFDALADIAELTGDTTAAKARAVVAHAKTLEAHGPETQSQVAHEGKGISFRGFAETI